MTASLTLWVEAVVNVTVDWLVDIQLSLTDSSGRFITYKKKTTRLSGCWPLPLLFVSWAAMVSVVRGSRLFNLNFNWVDCY